MDVALLLTFTQPVNCLGGEINLLIVWNYHESSRRLARLIVFKLRILLQELSSAGGGAGGGVFSKKLILGLHVHTKCIPPP